MACVNYEGSKIIYEHQTFDRNSLLFRIESLLNESINDLGL